MKSRSKFLTMVALFTVISISCKTARKLPEDVPSTENSLTASDRKKMVDSYRDIGDASTSIYLILDEIEEMAPEDSDLVDPESLSLTGGKEFRYLQEMLVNSDAKGGLRSINMIDFETQVKGLSRKMFNDGKVARLKKRGGAFKEVFSESLKGYHGIAKKGVTDGNFVSLKTNGNSRVLSVSNAFSQKSYSTIWPKSMKELNSIFTELDNAGKVSSGDVDVFIKVPIKKVDRVGAKYRVEMVQKVSGSHAWYKISPKVKVKKQIVEVAKVKIPKLDMKGNPPILVFVDNKVIEIPSHFTVGELKSHLRHYGQDVTGYKKGKFRNDSLTLQDLGFQVGGQPAPLRATKLLGDTSESTFGSVKVKKAPNLNPKIRELELHFALEKPPRKAALELNQYLKGISKNRSPEQVYSFLMHKRNYEGKNFAYFAARQGNLGALQALKDSMGDTLFSRYIANIEQLGKTPLMAAARSGDKNTIEFLLKHNSSRGVLDQIDYQIKENALGIAKMNNRAPEIINLLQKYY